MKIDFERLIQGANHSMFSTHIVLEEDLNFNNLLSALLDTGKEVVTVSDEEISSGNLQLYTTYKNITGIHRHVYDLLNGSLPERLDFVIEVDGKHFELVDDNLRDLLLVRVSNSLKGGIVG